MRDLLGQLIVLRTAQGSFVAAGRCIAQTDAPTVTIETPEGDRVHWREDMVEVLSDENAIVEALTPKRSKPPMEPDIREWAIKQGIIKEAS